MLRGLRSKDIIHYAAAKLFAACFILLLFAVCFAGISLYDLGEIVRSMFLLVPYAMAYSMIVDGISAIISRYAKLSRPAFIILKVLLYIIGGYIPFLFAWQLDYVFVIIAGTIGVVFALLYFGVYSWICRFPRYAMALSVVLSVIVVMLLTIDFTVKKGWSETQAEYSYEAEFAYFHGEHPIEIYAEQGDTVRYRIEWVIHSGGYGNHVQDKTGNMIGQLRSADDKTSSFRVEQNSDYKIVLTGDKLRGGVRVSWTIE